MSTCVLLPGAASLSFTREPTDTIVVPGSYAVLHCGADRVDVLSLTYEWWRNGHMQLPGGASVDGNGSLTISVPQGTDLESIENYEGFYHCFVSTGLNRLRSKDASLRGKCWNLVVSL